MFNNYWLEDLVEKKDNIDDFSFLYAPDKKEEKKMTFEDALDMTDVEIRYRFFYLDELLCSIDDEIMYLVEEIEKVKVDEQVAEEMLNLDFDTRDQLIRANRDRVQLNKRLKYLEEKYEIVMDLWDEMLLGILANIE